MHSYQNLTKTDFYNRMSPVACWKLEIIAGYSLTLFTTSTIVNASLLWIFYKSKELHTPVNVFVIVFTGLSLIGSLFQAPFVVASNYYCRYI